MRFQHLVLLLAMLWGVGARAQPAEGMEPLSAFPQSLLSIRTAAGKVINFQIWLADTPRRDQQGLMFVKDMDAHAGMLFLFPGNQPVSMWMKNTYIPLDMLFMDAKGRVDYIAANTTPFSTDIIGANKPEFAVLELNGGSAARFGIAVGDTVIHETFHKVPAKPTRGQ